MYISKSSELRCMSSMDIPLLEAGFTNSLRLCLEKGEIDQNLHSTNGLPDQTLTFKRLHLPDEPGTS